MPEVVEKIQAKHDVTPDEVEEALLAKPRVRKVCKGRLGGEDVYRALGRTEDGRFLAVFFIQIA